MSLLRARIRLEGPIASQLASGMIFGQICWVRRELLGEQALIQWLSTPERLWGLSDAFPADCLPRPLLPPLREEFLLDGTGQDRKALKALNLMTRSGFLGLRRSLSADKLNANNLVRRELRPHRTAHNSIDRHTSRPLEAAGLYFRNERWPQPVSTDGDWGASDADHDLYIEAPQAEAGEVASHLTHLGAMGFGKSAGLGRGRFSVLAVDLDPELETLDGANRYLSLSRGVTSENMGDLRCKLEPHFGKTGSQVSLTGASPFKRPILLTLPGATFTPTGSGRFGSWLTGVHPTRAEIGHNAFHLALPFFGPSDA